jgi:hypothetical protein
MKVEAGSGDAAPSGNTALRALRLSRHWTQAEFAAEFEKTSRDLGKVLSLSVRQVRRWESEDPPCPLPAYQRVLEEIFGVSVAQMGFQVGFEVPWAPRPAPERSHTVSTRSPGVEAVGPSGVGEAGGVVEHGRMAGLCRTTQPADRSGGHDPVRRRAFVSSAVAALGVVGAGDAAYGATAEAGQRLSAASDPAGRAVPFDRGMVDGYEFITAQQLTLYWMVPPARMYQPAVAHAQLGAALLSGSGPQNQRARLAGSLAQASLLAARLAHWDLQREDQARLHYRNALIAAREADDHEIGSAILGHLAFIPAYNGQAGEARDLMRAAYAHAARGVSKAQRSWLHAVDAEVESRLGDPKRAIDLIGRAEDAFYNGGTVVDDPQWQDYYDYTRLNGFKGFCHMNGGNADMAREALQNSLMALKPAEAKQRTVVLADLADIAVRTKDIEEACLTLGRALENLDAHWYAVGWARIETVFEKLKPYKEHRMVRELDNRIHSAWPSSIGLVGA